MNRSIDKRLTEVEDRKMDWAGQLDIVDYLGLDDYENNEDWIEIYFESVITVFKNKKTGEVRGAYIERRTDDEIRAAGGDPAYL